MKLEKFKDGHEKNKRMFLYGFILAVTLIIIINFLVTKANYRRAESFKIAEGTVNFSLVDFEIAELKVDGSPSESLPIGNYSLTSDSYCTTKTSNGEKDNNITLAYKDNTLSINKYTEKGTKCYLYFEDKSPKNLDELLGLYEKEAAPSGYTGTDTENYEYKLFTTQDNDGTSYFFRGNVKDNYVKFADKFWRIIRINGDGTLRLIYQGDTATGNGQLPSTSAYNTDRNDNTYVGYYTGSTGGNNFDNTHSSSTAGTIAGVLNDWYTKNIESKYDSYVDKNAGFCNDRTIATTTRSGYMGTGYGTSATAYKAADRLYDGSWSWLKTQTPTLMCGSSKTSAEYKRDYLTPKGANKGKAILDKPIGLITIDEVVFGGGFGGSNNTSYYLYTGQAYWTMSPSNMSTNGIAYVFYVNGGNLNGASVINTGPGVRPVVNLRADIEFEEGGEGTIDHPYVVKTN